LISTAKLNNVFISDFWVCLFVDARERSNFRQRWSCRRARI